MTQPMALISFRAYSFPFNIYHPPIKDLINQLNYVPVGAGRVFMLAGG